MLHTNWTSRNGAPQAIVALAQTPDGLLWMATRNGLFSFDGKSFTAFQPQGRAASLPANNAVALFVSHEGELWVTYNRAGVARVSHGEVSIFGKVAGVSKVEGERDFSFSWLQQDPSGNMWAICDEKYIVRLTSSGTWQVEESPVKDGGHVSSLFIDSAGTQWVVEGDRLHRKSIKEAHFRPTLVYVTGVTGAVEGTDHNLWLIGQTSTIERHGTDLQRVSPDGRRLALPVVFHYVLDVLPMPDNSVWVLESHVGLYRLKEERDPKDAISKWGIVDFYEANALTSNYMRCLLRDADSNVWVGGWKGLDRFKTAILVPVIRQASADRWMTCTNPQGEIWIARTDSLAPLNVFQGGALKTIQGTSFVAHLSCWSDGDISAIDNKGIVNVHLGRLERLPLLPSHKGFFSSWGFTSMARLSDGELIASERGATGHGGLWRYQCGKWERYLPDLISWPSSAMFVDAQKGLWLGRGDGTVDVLHGGRLQRISLESPGPGLIIGFTENSQGLFVFGANGVAFLRGNRLEMLAFSRPEQARNVTGLVQDRNGDFWLNGSAGILRIPKNEIRAAFITSGHRIQGTVISEGDFAGPAFFGATSPSAQIDTRGQLWFATVSGVVSLYPENLNRIAHPPHLLITSVSANGQKLGKSHSFPPNPQTLDIKYIGVNLSAPEKVIYRYRLEGLDDTWQDVGSREEAIYTRLKPGVYTFRVMASNGDGLWTAPVSPSAFRVLPSFYQTWWFDMLCVITSLLLVWLLLRVRVRHEVNAVRLRAEERADERIRIARELHDTLLQGVQGLLLSFHVAAQKLSADDESKRILDKALATADQIIIEGRNRVNRLRSEHLTDAELLESLERLGADLRNGQHVRYSVQRSGVAAVLHPYIADEVFCVMREALTNAFRHSAASDIRIELQYRMRSFRALCLDNGSGFDTHNQQECPALGHWGLRGMAERAERVGGQFSIRSAPGRGTEVLVTVPRYRAYLRVGFVKALGQRLGVCQKG